MVFRAFLVVVALLVIGGNSREEAEHHTNIKIPKVAIIGGGVGGTSAAFRLRSLFGDDLDLTLFEMGAVGGRVATIEMAGREYESGGSIIHGRNQEMVQHMEDLGLKRKVEAKVVKPHWQMSAFSLYSFRDLVFKLTDWSYFQSLQLVVRYGFMNCFRLDRMIEQMLRDFAKIYPFLDAMNSTQSLSGVLGEMTLTKETRESLISHMKSQGITSQELFEELTMVATRVNYGQVPQKMHALVGSVSLAGTNGDLFAIHGGNKQVPELLLQKSRAKFVPKQVTRVALQDDGALLVTSTEALDKDHLLNEGQSEVRAKGASSEDQSETFDVVIIAAPMTQDKVTLRLTDFPEKFSFSGRFHRTVATFVHGDLDPRFFSETSESVYPNNFFIEPTDELNSVSLLLPVDYDASDPDPPPTVFKIFSQELLTDEQLDEIFTQRFETKVADWLAYPKYEKQLKTLDEAGTRFKLHQGLYYVNAIEWAASAMEMSAIGGKNVANLIFQDWSGLGKMGKSTKEDKTEL